MPPEDLGAEQAPNNIYTVMLIVAFALVLFAIGLSFYELNAEFDFWGTSDIDLIE